MDKKTLLGLLIIGVILFSFSWYNSKQQSQFDEAKTLVDSLNAANAAAVQQTQKVEKITVTNSPAGDSLRTAQAEQALERHLGSSLFQATKGTETFYTVENDLMKIRFSNKGGRVASVELKDYKTYGGQPLVLFADTTSVFDLSFFIKQGYNDSPDQRTGDYYFTPADGDRPDFRGRAGAEKEFVHAVAVWIRPPMWITFTRSARTTT